MPDTTLRSDASLRSTSQRTQFTRIIGLGESYSKLPVLGRIKLGEPPDKGRNHPTASAHFEFPEDVLANFPEIIEAYTDGRGVLQPKRLEILLPWDDLNLIFPHSYTLFGSSNRIKCQGDGVDAVQRLCQKCEKMSCKHYDAPRIERPVKCRDQRNCPEAESRMCLPNSGLRFILYRVTWCGVFEVWTHAWGSLRGLRDGLAGIRNQCGRIAYVPLHLRLVLTPIKYDGKRTKKHLLRIGIDPRIELVKKHLADTPPILSLELPTESVPDIEPEPTSRTKGGATAEAEDTSASPQEKSPASDGPAAAAAEPAEPITQLQVNVLGKLARLLKWDQRDWLDLLNTFGAERLGTLTKAQATEFESLQIKQIQRVREELIAEIKDKIPQIGPTAFDQIIAAGGLAEPWTDSGIEELRAVRDELKGIQPTTDNEAAAAPNGAKAPKGGDTKDGDGELF